MNNIREIGCVLWILLMWSQISFANYSKDSIGLNSSIGYSSYSYSMVTAPLNKKVAMKKFPISFSSIQSSKESKPAINFFRAMRYSGHSRFYVFYRDMKEYYNITPIEGLTLPVNLTIADGYQQPLMLFRLEGNPTAKSWFQSEIQFDHLFLRTTSRTNQDGRYANLFVIFQMQAGMDTRFGKLRMIAGGGANWYRLSPSTLWGYQYRDDFFERYPWEPEGHDFNRYNSFYSVGDIPRDQRFGMQATQGFILEGTNMPAGFDAAILFGKTSSSSGFQSYKTSDPINMLGGRIGKKLGDHKMGFNYLSQFGYYGNQVEYKKVANGSDTVFVDDNYFSSIITTVDARFEFKNINVFTEVGAGSYLTNQYNVGVKENAKPGENNISHYQRDWDESLFLELTTKRKITYIPMKLGLYRIGGLVVNNSNSVANTSIESAKANPTTPNEYYTNYFDGLVTEIGQLANNRQGMNLTMNKDFFYKKVKTKLGIAVAQEIQNLAGDMRNGARGLAINPTADSASLVPYTNSITFEHKLNGITRSRFGMFKRFTGPYGRFHSIYRRAFENVAITDSIINYKKSFSSLELESKYKCRLFGKELILMNFTSFYSVQDRWQPIPVFTDKAFIRYFYEELMLFYGIHPKLTLVGFYGYEQIRGNHRVEVADENGNVIKDSKGRPIADPNGKTLHQVGNGFGLGLDYNFHTRASMHLRNRWFDFYDKNFVLDQFRGNEMTVEFKVFF